MPGMGQLISIGRFANLTDLSPRLLRKLDERGLLSPTYVDPDTRYRYYDYGQVRRHRVPDAPPVVTPDAGDRPSLASVVTAQATVSPTLSLM